MRNAFLLAFAACAGSSAAVQPAVSVRDPEVTRALTPDEWEQLDTTIRQKVRVVSVSCYDPELNRLRDRKFFGNVTVNIHIARGGSSDQVDANESSLPIDKPEYRDAAQRVQQCLSDLIKSWEFSVTHADAWFLYTFHFEPQY